MYIYIWLLLWRMVTAFLCDEFTFFVISLNKKTSAACAGDAAARTHQFASHCRKLLKWESRSENGSAKCSALWGVSCQCRFCTFSSADSSSRVSLGVHFCLISNWWLIRERHQVLCARHYVYGNRYIELTNTHAQMYNKHKQNESAGCGRRTHAPLVYLRLRFLWKSTLLCASVDDDSLTNKLLFAKYGLLVVAG